MKTDNQLLAAITVNGTSASLTPLVSNLQPILSVILTAVQIAVAVVTVLVLVRQYKKSKKDD